jgi:hypothetical protein
MGAHLARRRTYVGILGAVLLAAACGTTVPADQRVAAGRSLDGGAVEAGDSLEGSTDTTLAASGSAGASSAAGRRATQTAAPTGGPAQQTRGKAPIAPGTHGVTDTTVEVGLMEFDPTESNAVNRATGGGDINGEGAMSGRQIDAEVVKYINAHGGLGGRKVVPIYASQSVVQYATASGRQRQQQQACDTLTADHHVFFLSGAGATEELMLDCDQDPDHGESDHDLSGRAACRLAVLVRPERPHR